MGSKCVFVLRKAPLLIQEVDVSILFAPPNVPRVVLCPVRVYMGNVLHSQYKVLGYRFIFDVSDQNEVITNADFFFWKSSVFICQDRKPLNGNQQFGEVGPASTRKHKYFLRIMSIHLPTVHEFSPTLSHVEAIPYYQTHSSYFICDQENPSFGSEWTIA